MKKTELMSIINSVVDQALENCESENPLEAWSRFMDRFDACVRRRIGENLERNGRNRYTGENTGEIIETESEVAEGED